jgi:hypothetical protein
MATHFERSAVQLFFEQKLGCDDPNNFTDFLDQLVQIQLTLADANTLADSAIADIRGQFERCALTLLQAIADLESGNRLWATVKLYYSVFYALRVELHINGFSMVRCGKVFTSDRKQGSLLKRYNNSEKGDHGIAISLVTKHLSQTDILLDAKLEDKTTYLWMKNLREIVQYKMRTPPETVDYDPFFPRDQISISDQIDLFLQDRDPYYCFDPDFAALAIPIKRLQLTSSHVKNERIDLSDSFKNIIDDIFAKHPSTRLLKPYFW